MGLHWSLLRRQLGPSYPPTFDLWRFPLDDRFSIVFHGQIFAQKSFD
jgi:hypothetical protein